MRMKHDKRYNLILETAILLAEKHGYNKVTRQLIADTINITVPLVTYYFESMSNLKKAIVKKAIEDKNLKIVLQAISMNEDVLIDKDMRDDILKFLGV